MRVFDELVSNVYRKVGAAFNTSRIWDNLLITREWNVWLIDHTRTFGARRQLENTRSLTRCDRVVLSHLRELNTDAFRLRLGKYLSSDQIDALEARRGLLVKHFDDLIARQGDALVLYDLPPRQ